jgi:bifunctional polynucleotide phosphatase/kinase
VYEERGYEIDMDRSVYVGDAAGRVASKGVAKDHSDTDYKWALNVGLKFLTPEVSSLYVRALMQEHFLSQPRPVFPEPPIGFLPSHLASLAARKSSPPPRNRR